jgi:sugar phosphate isomerase/epimerase
VTLTALNCNGNPLHPVKDFPHAKDLIESIELAALLGVKRVITMSGTPGVDPGSTNPAWNPLPWWSPFLDVRDHQWGVAIPFWKDIQARAADADVKVAIEMHPGNIVFNPSTMHRLAEEINATHVGAEMDPSHLFWQGIDPVLAVADLGELVYIAAAKDTRINEAAKINGVLDDRFTRVAEGEPGYLPLGGGTTLSGWPTNSSWDFVAVGRGHDTAYWTEFLRALQKVDPDMPVNIEHEDQELDQMEGLRFAANTLLEAEKAL